MPALDIHSRKPPLTTARAYAHSVQSPFSAPCFRSICLPASPARVLLYSHDSFGLGHLRRCRALVIESFGVGGLPERGGMHALVKSAALEGKAIVMTTQVQNEGSDLAVYGTGSALARSPGIMESEGI